jgi:enediyne biosynthesis protein E4
MNTKWLWLGAAFTHTAAWAASSACPAPRLQAERLLVADDGRDRGYPGGLSLGDVDGDGDLDLLATRGYDPTAKTYRGDRSLLYLNKGDGSFARSESPFADKDTPDSGGTLADVDNDGDLDAYISTQHKKQNRFFVNEGRGRFVEATLGDATSDASSNFASAFVDIDVDGDLDLYATGPTLELNDVNLAFRNDGGRFSAVTGVAIDNGKNNPAASLWADVDNDGDPDLLVANSDVMRLSGYPAPPLEHAVLYRNDGGWTFTATVGQAFSTPAHPAISAAFGDIDNDGDFDLFLGSHVYKVDPRPDWLFLNDGAGRFTRAPQQFPAHKATATGAAFADFNGDGALDLLAISYEGPIELYVGDGAGAFKRLDDPALSEAKLGRWSAVTGDIDADGRIDALLGSWGETAEGDYITILRNRTPRCGSWVELTVLSASGAPNPPGARVTLTTAANDRPLRQLREASAQTGFRSQSGSAFLFATPPGHSVQHADIRWPDGRTRRLERIGVGRRIDIAYPSAENPPVR